MDNITFEQIAGRADCLRKIDRENNFSFIKSYFHFVGYFSKRDEITEHDLVIGANFTYGWMPTILNFKSRDFELSVEILNKVKNDLRITSDEIKHLKQLINNSLVGVSKLLHFLSPFVYAMWDSRVCKFLTGKSYKQKVENINLFLSYLNLCARIVEDPRFAPIHEDHIRRIGYEISPMRTIEQIMFLSSDKPIVT